MTTHDYTVRGWSWDYTFTPINGGYQGRMSGWSRGVRIEAGDLLRLMNDATGVAVHYRVESIRYHRDPPDMWAAEVCFEVEGQD